MLWTLYSFYPSCHIWVLRHLIQEGSTFRGIFVFSVGFLLLKINNSESRCWRNEAETLYKAAIWLAQEPSLPSVRLCSLSLPRVHLTQPSWRCSQILRQEASYQSKSSDFNQIEFSIWSIEVKSISRWYWPHKVGGPPQTVRTWCQTGSSSPAHGRKFAHKDYSTLCNEWECVLESEGLNSLLNGTGSFMNINLDMYLSFSQFQISQKHYSAW